MEGRRVTRKSKKYNPLFILFLCLVAAVFILLIVSIVLGVRLGSANKKLKASEKQVAELTETVNRLEEEIEKANKTPAPSTPAPALPSSSVGTDPAATTNPTGAETPGAATGDWLDLTGHSEVKIKPTTLLSGFTDYYTTAGVNMRSGPATSYDRIDTIDYGEKVQVAAREGGWSFAKYENKFGWISSDYLSTTEPPKTSSSSSSTRTEATSGSIRR
ncbi:MAG: hypothetical protein E7474_07155 [Ruminococcaceae bacterium]|nr:hypothetical protein [Oscillospiraceae bacterium]